ncbi:MAG: histidine--tRNA ligase [Rhodospirillaceae bacterium]|jgi:histidyl-tRNA synthetase|nr:histidine--tRNA ligase [Rhodospirillaceae bacterium]
MYTLKSVRGTHDLLFDEAIRHRLIEEISSNIVKLYGFSEIITPIFEFTDIFSRNLGETTDVVSKEMYTFIDRSGKSLTLRPEGTTSVVRAFISGKLFQNLPLKLFYRGPMFRYERPQKGRLRQFHQFGIELLGVESPQADIEVITLAVHIIEALGLKNNVHLELNSLGDKTSRIAYRDVFVDYITKHKNKLSKYSLNRLDRNPLRILDSKNDVDKIIIAEAPLMINYLNDYSRKFFDTVKNGLDTVGIPFTVNSRLIRGLDYYCHTTFEFITTALGVQDAVLSGGRYDGLINKMGGPKISGIGWAAGIDRLSMLFCSKESTNRPLVIIPMKLNEDAAIKLAKKLRYDGFIVEMDYSGSMKKSLAVANKISARAALLLFEEEWCRQAVIVRDLDTGKQEEISVMFLKNYLDKFR